MRILQLIQKKQYRGAEIFCCQLSDHLIKAGHEVEVYSIFDGSAELPFYGKKVQSLKRHPGRRFVDYKGWRQLAHVVEDFKPDVIQANAADTLKYAVMSKLVFKWKIPLVYRNASAFSFYAKSRFSRIVNSFLLRRVDVIISVSQASKNDLNKLFPFTRSKSSVIPVGVEEKTDSNSITPVEFKEKINLIHIGSFTSEKNHFGILNIFGQVRSEIPGVGLHLLGDGPLREEIQERVKKLGLEDSVHFHGEVRDPFPYLQASDVLILPSFIEGLPGVILEAMYSKVSVVAYNVGGIPEIINDNTGTIIEKNRERVFAGAVVNELKCPDKLKLKKAHRMIEKNFLNKKIIKEFLKVYEELSGVKQ